MVRDWGPWTIIKLEALEKYYSAFTTASQRARKTLYLDLFGGRPDNKGRESDEVFSGSAVRAAETRPPFTKMIITELEDTAANEQRRRLRDLAGNRAWVVSGDCNEKMPEALRELVRRDDGFRFAPTFALVDQYAAEIHWETLETLASFKDPRRTKVELCLYFSSSFVVRGLIRPDGSANHEYAARVDRMFGNDDWRELMAARDDGMLTPHDAQVELVNLMRWQLENDLGYRTTLPLQVRNTRGTEIFSLIFATDHDVGTKIMQDLFIGAEGAMNDMVARAKIRRRETRQSELGIDGLFSGEGLTSKAPKPKPSLAPPLEPLHFSRKWRGPLGD